MYIKEVVVDGWKCYQNRTVLTGFDKFFNAITGENGSGKSAFLEAICFVLGINTSKIRVEKIEELVYTGLKKATVTLVLNNEEKNISPIGYDQFDEITVSRQIIIGGRNKYLINGHNAQVERVKNLFHSVGLNANNPHFLIMQNQILRVVKMSPKETLSLVEEGAGTRLFQQKKEESEKLIKKKEEKVRDIQKTLETEIQPKLRKLREEQEQYNQFSKRQADIETYTRFVVAYQYHKSKEILKKFDCDVEEKREQLEELNQKKKSLAKSLKKIQDEIKRLQDSKDKEMKKELGKYETSYSNQRKDFTAQESEYLQVKEEFETAQKEKENKQKELKEILDTINEKQEEIQSLKTKFSQAEKNHEKIKDDYQKLQQKYETLVTGLTFTDQGEKSLTSKLITSKDEIRNVQSKIEKSQLKIKNLEDESKRMKQSGKKKNQEYNSLLEEQNQLKQELENLQKEMDQLLPKGKTISMLEEEFSQKEKEKKEKETEFFQLRDNIRMLKNQVGSQLVFEYQDPEPNFDRTKVKGLIAKLIDIKDPSYSTALEVTAGAKLFNVVVDDESTGKKLLSNGNLKRRVTIIPLNKIASSVISNDKIQTAKKLVGKENVDMALSLVGYDHEVEAAMKHVFGSSFIVKDSKTGNTVTFNNKIKTKSITLQGDIFDPKGSLTGGSRPKTSLLVTLQELLKNEKKQSQSDDQLTKMNQDFSKLKNTIQRFRILKNDHEIKYHQQKHLETTIMQSSHGMILQQEKEILESIENEKKNIKELEEKKKEIEKEIQRLEKEIKGDENMNKEQKAKQLNKEIENTKKQLLESEKKNKSHNQKIREILAIIEQGKKDVQDYEKEIKEIEKKIKSIQSKLEKQKQIFESAKEKHDKAKEAYDKKKESLYECDEEIQTLKTKEEEINSESTEIDLEIKSLEHKISNFQNTQKGASETVSRLKKEHKWIESEEKFFGKPHTDYDFQANDPEKMEFELNKMKNENQQQAKRINRKVLNMFTQAENEYKELEDKKTRIEQDRKKIEQVIEELDQKKKEVLNQTWQKVNKDFGSIFGMLFPGSSAKLEAPQGKTLFDGLEMKVRMGEKWKDNLNSCSGGQKSILALSLVLALLLSKPAPIYILDEIDAALDDSKVQNVAQMLKAHFGRSQFLIVSHRPDMYSSANVRFECKKDKGSGTTVNRIKSNSNSIPSVKSINNNKGKENSKQKN